MRVGRVPSRSGDLLFTLTLTCLVPLLTPIILAAADEGHLGGHDGHELHVGF